MSLQIYTETQIPKFHNGKWIWNINDEEFTFKKSDYEYTPINSIEIPLKKFGIKFNDNWSQKDEIIFRKKFQRSKLSKNFDVITIQDIKNVVLFSVPPNGCLTKNVIDFFYTNVVDEFLNSLIIYFEYFLRTVQFLLKRRLESKGDTGRMHNMNSVMVERIVSKNLAEYRLLLAREYSKIIMGSDDAYIFHHLSNKMRKSKTEKDRLFFETFLCISTKIVWIAMHREFYAVLDFEMNRLFRSNYFNVHECQKDTMKFTFREQQILYGPNELFYNYMSQRSPLIQEILNIKSDNTALLWIGENKYRGNDPRLVKLELEYVTPDAQLGLINCRHGILGHPKKLYNTVLVLDWNAVRKEDFSKDYDPYQLLVKPTVETNVPDKSYFNDQSMFKIIKNPFDDINLQIDQKDLWKNKEKIINSITEYNLENENIYNKIQREIETINQPIEIDREKIISSFLLMKKLKIK